MLETVLTQHAGWNMSFFLFFCWNKCKQVESWYDHKNMFCSLFGLESIQDLIFSFNFQKKSLKMSFFFFVEVNVNKLKADIDMIM